MMTVEEINDVPLKLGAEDWTFCFYKHLTPFFLDDRGSLSESVKKIFLNLTNLRKNNFRKQLHIKSVPSPAEPNVGFLAGVFFVDNFDFLIFRGTSSTKQEVKKIRRTKSIFFLIISVISINYFRYYPLFI